MMIKATNLYQFDVKLEVTNEHEIAIVDGSYILHVCLLLFG